MGLTEFLLVVAVGGGITAVLFATLKGAAGEAGGSESRGAGRPESDARAEVDEQRRAALRSLEEIEADREAGNLSDADYERLRRRYEKELARVGGGLGPAAGRPDREAAPRAAPARGSHASHAVAWAAGSVAFVALAALVLSQALRPRAGGETITGSLPGQEMGSGAAGPALAEVDPERLAALERMVRADSSNVAALVELGHLYLAQQRFADVAQLSMRALDLEPGNPEALTHLGMVLVTVDHMADAMAAFDSALASDPNFGEALQFKGMVAFMTRDYPAAVQAWERYLEVVPAQEQAPRARAMLELARANAGGGS
jgi:cytochrome c-type biogenesis protein CcmH/NrfG